MTHVQYTCENRLGFFLLLQALSCNDWDENPPTIEVDMWDESRMEVNVS